MSEVAAGHPFADRGSLARAEHGVSLSCQGGSDFCGRHWPLARERCRIHDRLHRAHASQENLALGFGVGSEATGGGDGGATPFALPRYDTYLLGGWLGRLHSGSSLRDSDRRTWR